MNDNWSIEQHLEELRYRLLFCLLSLAMALFVGFYFCPFVLKVLEGLAPENTIFFQFKPGEFLFVYCKLATIISVIVVAPIFIWQILAFMWSGLKYDERVIALILAIGVPILFIIGNLFAYFCAIKPLLTFILGFGVENQLIKPQYSIDYFISLLISLSLVFGIVFQIPIIVFAFAFFNLIKSEILWNYWRQAIFASFIIAAIATPTPDPFNMFIVGIAICLLYIISIFFVKMLELMR